MNLALVSVEHSQSWPGASVANAFSTKALKF
jgi:hypothetical protein